MAKVKPLTAKQEAFSVEYVDNGGNASAAYRHAYDAENTSERVIWVEASKLLSSPKVSIRVQELQEARRAVIQWTDEERLKRLKEITEKDDDRAAISAISEANKMLGSHAPEKKELSGKVGGGEVSVTINPVPAKKHDDL